MFVFLCEKPECMPYENISEFGKRLEGVIKKLKPIYLRYESIPVNYA